MRLTLPVKSLMLTTVLILGPASASRASGLETNGIGARGRAMGNAMVAVADDWTAIQYNPAGLGFMGSRQFGFVYELFTGGLSSTSSLRNLPPDQGPDPSRGDFIDLTGNEPSSFNEKGILATVHYGEMGYVAPLRRSVVGVALYGSGSGTAWDDTLITSSGDNLDAEISFTNGSANIPLAVGRKVTPELAIGAGAALRLGILDTEISKERTGSLPYLQHARQETTGTALSADLGVLWKPDSRWSAGGVIRFPYRIRKEGETSVTDTLLSLDVASDLTVLESYPLRISGGVAWRPDDRTILALGWTWMDWSSYSQKVQYEDPVPGVLEDSKSNPADWEDTVVINLGYERALTDLWDLRLGLLYDQAPEPEQYRTLIGGLVVDSWKASAGAGYRMGRTRVNFGYSFTYGPEVDGYIPGAGYSVRLHEYYAGIDWLI